jgi:hypothetical protein
MGSIYRITFSKKKYFSKSIIIDAKTNYSKSDAPPKNSLDIPIELNLKKELKKRRKLGKNFIAGKLVVDKRYGSLVIDAAYTSEQRKLYEQSIKDKK